ncbi:hypothetical protein SLEP1_g33037 [Rubroshorea leprosula]|uniref:ABC transporter domain-containing protein n=1 Tax=Rubroshorea leprosula TaxID=152421 RepID=A0AAV5KFE1_9ROSI|nr:hypothetical protein SLEP1_g33037 [Rubroshorea leprosula]
MGSSFHQESSDASAAASSFSMKEDNNEVELQWAAIERLPTFRRIRSSLFPSDGKEEREREVIDVTKLGAPERQVFIERLITRVEEDNLRLLKKLKERMERVGLELPTTEVRYQNLCVEAECEVVQGKPLPTLWNTIRGVFSAVTNVGRCNMQRINFKILKDVSGIIKPSRMTLLLGPPGCGKTTLLQALAGNLNPSLEVTGEITYNGYKLSEFVPQKTSAYVSQYDLHISEMTVRETLDFSAHCQGIGSRTDTMKEISRREKQLGVIPDPDIDTYMKATSVKGSKGTLQTDYTLKILGLDTCADTNVGDAINRGISGGQKKRLTTGEMIIGPTKTLFMDEISNGLDTSTTFQIVTYLQQMAHITDATVIMSLLQPAPETFDLFDDIILMAEGKIVYHGPRSNVQEFFEHCGFRCPPRKGVADYLQEVISKKDQAQYWYHKDHPYSYVSIDKFRAAFKDFHVGQKLDEELCIPFNKNESHKSALSFKIYTLKKWELFKACMAREWLLMKRNSFIHIFKTGQLVVIALITTTLFIRTRMKVDMVHATYYMGSLFYALVRLMSNGIAELSFTVSRLAVFYKQRDLYFYPAWAYSIPAAILKIPFSLIDAFLWTVLTYYGIGYSPEPQRFFKQVLVLFLLHQVAISLFRVIASIARNPAVAATLGPFSLLVLYLFSGFAIPLESLPTWIKWGFWISPMAYAEIGISLNEFLAPRWQKLILMKRGGRIIYYGELGQHSNKLVEYFEGIPGVPKIKENYNPATWMLEVTNPSAEAQLQVDFASLYKESHLYRRNKELVKELSLPADASEELCFPTRFPQNGWEQFKACLWKQHLSYWRSPTYNLARLSVVTAASLLYGVLLWQKGQKIGTEQDLFNIMGSVHIFMIIIGVSGCSSVMPFVGTQRTVFYRERFAGMYSSWAYSLSQVIIEIPYIFLEAVLFSMITYPAINFYKSAYKVLWFLYAMFCTLLYFKYLGLMLVSLTPTSQVAAIFASFSSTLLSLFSGYLIPEPQIPKWWVWAYWICPSSWSVEGIVTSQYADVNKVITAFGEQKTISAFLESQQGYKHQDLPIIAIVLLAFPLFFASIFAYCISKLNFQRR